LARASADGTVYSLVEDDGSRALFMDRTLRDRPVRLTAVAAPGSKDLRVVFVQTVKNGAAYDIDYWCEVCQITHNYPGDCVCCGDPLEFRERPAK
jgi:hypothetical protein